LLDVPFSFPETVLPNRHDPEEQRHLHVDEQCKVITSDRHLGGLHSVERAGDLVGG